MINRRDFLNAALAAAAGGPLASQAWGRSYSSISGHDGPPPRYLILVELIGGNDGLNTVVPYTDPNYAKLRPSLAIDPDKLIKLRDGLGLHPALAPLYPLFQKRELAIINSVGHDSPVDSHYRAAEIWDTGHTDLARLEPGWVASLMPPKRYYREYVARGICLGQNPGPLEGGEYMLSMPSLEALFVTQRQGVLTDVVEGHEALSHMLQVQASLKRGEKIPNNRFDRLPSYEGFTMDELGRGLHDASAMITHGAAAPVIKVSLSGFDTHKNQAAIHSEKLSSLAVNLARFRELMHSKGFWPQIMVMTYSEFGRSARENADAGTDHGHSAPHLVMSSGIKGDIYGDAPPLDTDGGLAYQIDFRRMINTAAHDWLGTRSSQINIKRYPPLPLVDLSFRRKRTLL